VPLSTQECKLLGKPNKLRGMTSDGLASRPGGVQKPGISSGSYEPVGSKALFNE